MPLIIDAASECVSIGVFNGLGFVGTPSSGDDLAFYGVEWPLATGFAIATSARKGHQTCSKPRREIKLQIKAHKKSWVRVYNERNIKA